MELEQFLGHMDTQDFFKGKRWFNKGNQWLTLGCDIEGDDLELGVDLFPYLIGKLKRPRISSNFLGFENHSSGDHPRSTFPQSQATNWREVEPPLKIRQQCSEKLWPVLSYSMPYQKVSTLPSWSFLDVRDVREVWRFCLGFYDG